VALFATLPVFVIFLSLMTLYKGEPESFNMSWSHFIVRFLKHLGDNSIYAFTIATGNGEYSPCNAMSQLNKRLMKFINHFLGEHVRDNFFVLKILTGAWCLMFVVITNSYTGNLTSDLAVPALKPIPNSLEELALNDEISLIVDDKSTVAEMILVTIFNTL